MSLSIVMHSAPKATRFAKLATPVKAPQIKASQNLATRYFSSADKPSQLSKPVSQSVSFFSQTPFFESTKPIVPHFSPPVLLPTAVSPPDTGALIQAKEGDQALLTQANTASASGAQSDTVKSTSLTANQKKDLLATGAIVSVLAPLAVTLGQDKTELGLAVVSGLIATLGTFPSFIAGQAALASKKPITELFAELGSAVKLDKNLVLRLSNLGVRRGVFYNLAKRMNDSLLQAGVDPMSALVLTAVTSATLEQLFLSIQDGKAFYEGKGPVNTIADRVSAYTKGLQEKANFGKAEVVAAILSDEKKSLEFFALYITSKNESLKTDQDIARVFNDYKALVSSDDFLDKLALTPVEKAAARDAVQQTPLETTLRKITLQKFNEILGRTFMASLFRDGTMSGVLAYIMGSKPTAGTEDLHKNAASAAAEGSLPAMVTELKDFLLSPSMAYGTCLLATVPAQAMVASQRNNGSEASLKKLFSSWDDAAKKVAGRILLTGVPVRTYVYTREQMINMNKPKGADPQVAADSAQTAASVFDNLTNANHDVILSQALDIMLNFFV